MPVMAVRAKEVCFTGKSLTVYFFAGEHLHVMDATAALRITVRRLRDRARRR